MIKKLDIEDRGILEATLKKTREKLESKGVKDNLQDDPSKRPDTTSRLTKAQEISDQYETIISLAQEIQSIIKDRSKDVKFIFTQEQNISLRDAIRRVFGTDTDTVTYDMYQHCLNLQEQIAEQDRESMRDL